MHSVIEGLANEPKYGKFWVLLSCGHRILCDHSVDSTHVFKCGTEVVCVKCEESDGL